MNNTTSIALGIVIAALLIRRQLRVRPVRESAPVIFLGVLVVLGIASVSSGVKSVTTYHPLPASAVAILAASLVLAAAFGYVRARSMRVWRGPAGELLSQGTAVTAALWVVAILVHFGMDAWVDHLVKVGSLGFSTIYLYLAVTFGIQGLVLRGRAADPSSAPGQGSSPLNAAG